MSGAYSSSSAPRGQLSSRILHHRGLLIGFILLAALIGFEMFNFSTTEVALQDLLGDLKILGVSWATILTIAFCGIDFAGIARLFIPEESQPSANESWYLFGAWLLAATMNAVLTWWGISLSLVNRIPQAATFIDLNTITGVVPVFVALMVWVTRILLIGSFSVAGSRLFSEGVTVEKQQAEPILGPLQSLPISRPVPQPIRQPVMSVNVPRPRSNPRADRVIGEPEYISEPSYAAGQVSPRPAANRNESNPSGKRPARF